MAYSMAAMPARLVPSKVWAIMARAADYAQHRLVCEELFPGDVSAGQALGVVIAERLIAQSALQVHYAAAHIELRKAGLTS